MEDNSPQPESNTEPKVEDNQKLIHKITRFAGFGFLAVGALILLTGGDIILGSILLLIGITDIILVPHIIETVITEKLKQRNDKAE